MWLVDPILRRFATPEDRKILADEPGMVTRMRVIARTGLRYFWVYLVVLLLLVTVTFGSGMDIYHRTEVPEFCASCHEMEVNLARWKAPLHKSLACASCHTRPGVAGWVSAKMGGIRQVLTHFTETIPSPEMTVEQFEITSENCRRCHMGAARLGERHGLVISHKRHLEIGVQCVQCHSRIFAHPKLTKEGRTDITWKPPLVHTPRCFECHDGEGRFQGAVAFRQDDEENCERCHPDAGLGNHHGGVELDCSDCHELVEYGPEDERRRHYPVHQETVAEEICGLCHDDVLEEKYASMHMPFQEGMCLQCHRVMTPSHLYLTGSKPTVDTCLLGGCHSMLTGVLQGDPQAGQTLFADGGTDLHRRHGALLGDKRDWCMSCHATHGSDSPVAQVRLRGGAKGGDGEEPGKFEADPSGGTCTGACHGGERVRYTRGEGESR